MSIQIDSDRNAIEKDGKLVDPETGEDLGNFWDLSCKVGGSPSTIIECG